MINPKVCPFCKEDNKCEAHIPNNDCWCNHIKVPEELRLMVPKEFKLKACICKKCVLEFINNKESFIKKFV